MAALHFHPHEHSTRLGLKGAMNVRHAHQHTHGDIDQEHAHFHSHPLEDPAPHQPEGGDQDKGADGPTDLVAGEIRVSVTIGDRKQNIRSR